MPKKAAAEAPGKKECRLCLYNNGMRVDGTWRCITPERQLDKAAKDCCIPEAPLRKIQASSVNAETFIFQTRKYVSGVKAESSYWKKLNKQNGG
jgi:hypothetical protein